MRSRSSSPSISVNNNNNHHYHEQTSNPSKMSDSSSNPQQISSRGGNNDLGSKKQEPSYHGRQQQQNSSGARQKIGRPQKFQGGPPLVHHHGGGVGRRGRGSRMAPPKEMSPYSKPEPFMGQDPEMGSIYKSGSKKSNYNHLLNFDYGPHRGVNDVRRGAHQPKEGGRRRHPTSPKSKYTKEHYLQANCQFLVRKERDYSTHINNPDLPLDWDNIEMVRLRTNDYPSCPICLYQPRAAKMTRCGHIYCWQCILHYLALSDDDWRKCPICEECIGKQDLKSVVTIPFSEYAIGDEIKMDLMRRNRTSMFAYSLTNFAEEYEGKFPYISQEYTSYSRIVVASPDEVIKHIIDKEKKTLVECYESDKDEPESCFILEALNALEERTKMLLLEVEALKDIPFIDKLSLSEALAVVPTEPSFDHLRAGLEHELIATATAASPARKELFNFYQSSDGQKIFLHGLNAKMLERQFGDLMNAPFSIKGKILEREMITVTEEFRSKFRYLRHLPLLSNIEFVELDLGASLDFDDGVVEEFKMQIEERKRKRQRKARDERKREKKILIEENKMMGKYPNPKYRIESNYHFPDIGQEFNLGGEGDNASAQNDNGVATFAKIIRKGGPPKMKRSETFPTLGGGLPKVSPFEGVLNRSTMDSDEEDAPSYVPEKPSINLDLSTGVVVVKNKKGKKKSKNMVMLSSAPRPMI